MFIVQLILFTYPVSIFTKYDINYFIGGVLIVYRKGKACLRPFLNFISFIYRYFVCFNGNVYKISGISGGANFNSKNFSINKILDAVSFEITKDLANVNLVEYNNPKTALKDAISGLNGSVSVNAGKIQFATSDGKRVASGITTDTASINISVTYIDPIE